MDTLDAWLVVLQDVKNGTANDAVYNYLWKGDLGRLSRDLARAEKLREITLSQAYGRSKKTRQGQLSRILGRHFESMIKRLFDDCDALSFQQNVRTTTSEIDCLFVLNPTAGVIPFLSNAGTHLIGEAKFYKEALKTEWANELIGILDGHGARVAILFVGCKSKKVHSAFRTQVAIHAAGNKFIVPFGLKQFHQVLSGENFLKILNQQFVQLRIHTNELWV